MTQPRRANRSLSRAPSIRWAWLIAVVLAASLLIPPSGALAQEGASAEFSFNFENDVEGWTVGFADLPVNHDQSIYDLDSGHRRLPDGLEGSGVYLQGHNRSDDLFMFLKRQVDGLRPNAAYAVSASLDLATNVPTAAFGIGGSPGESVYVKAGASTIEPVAVEGDDGHLRMNVDKGNQSTGGKAAIVLGNVSHPDVMQGEYRIKTLDNAGRPLTVNADSDGRVWLLVGTDSGFEGLSAFYYARISYTLNALELPVVGGLAPTGWALALMAGAGAALVGLGLLPLRRRA